MITESDPPVTSYSERRKRREELERAQVEGLNLDPTVRCQCPHCGAVHYKSKVKVEESNG